MTLVLDSVTVSLARKRLAGPLSLTVGAGEIVTLMGPSGCGKSSLLDHIGGVLAPPLSGEGKIQLSLRRIDMLPPEQRRIGRLFQDDLLFPHLSVAENLMFGMPRGNRALRRQDASAALAQAGLSGFDDRPPDALSGGQRSRVALLRALLARPDAVLLDEPFSKLDAELRADMRQFVFDHLRERGIPALLVTHDPEDAPPGGRILRIGRSDEVRHD